MLASEYGGDFSSNGLSGVDPGASAGTMGTKPASAMAIGTGKKSQRYLVYLDLHSQ